MEGKGREGLSYPFNMLRCKLSFFFKSFLSIHPVVVHNMLPYWGTTSIIYPHLPPVYHRQYCVSAEYLLKCTLSNTQRGLRSL